MKCAVFVLIISVCIGDGKQLPSFIEKCKRNDPQVNECMKKALMDIRVHIRESIKELKIPAFKPYTFPAAHLTTGWMNATLTNIRSYYADVYEIDTFKIDFDNNPFIEMTYTYPYSQLKADYKLDGKLLQLTIHGEGDLELTFNDTKSSVRIEGHTIQKNGKKYMNIDKTDYKVVSTQIGRIRLNNLFRNNPELTDRINRLFADEQETYYEEMRPLVNQITSAVVSTLFKGVFDTFSLDELFD